MATFTALNGGSPKASDGVNGSSVEAKRASAEEQRSSTAPAPAPAPAPTSESPTTKSPVQTESTSAAAVATVGQSERERASGREQQGREAERERERPRSSWAAPRPTEERPPYRATTYPDVQQGSPSKRKRSRSPPTASQDSPRDRYDRRGQSEPRDGARVESRDGDSASPPKPSSSYYDAELRRIQGRERAREAERGGNRLRFTLLGVKDDNWGPNYEQPQSAVPDSAVSEVDPIGDLNQAIEAYDERQSPDMDIDESPLTAYPGGNFAPDPRRDGLIQSDPKKRKRNFSNRTKTGCLTCRRRKKKCDEAKPECSNCIKGGFVCAGYPPQRGTWPKPESKPATVQIESKDPTYVPPGAYGMPQPAAFNNASNNHPVMVPPPPPKREPLPSYRGQPLRIETPPQRLLTDEGRPMPLPNPTSGSVSEPAKRSLFGSVPVNTLPTPVSAQTPKEFPGTRVPPLHDLSRKGPEPTSAPKAGLLPQISITNPSGMNSPPSKPASGVQATAQMALSHTFSSPSRPRREKDEMLAGNPFYPYDKELVLERERCSTSVWRFNNSNNPGNGVSTTERCRLFREILQPSEGVQLSQAQVSPVTHTGQLGGGVVVEAPFHTEYGYNIKIADNVAIGRNCSIIDAAEVTIGTNTVISPNVSIFTVELPLDPRRRNGARSSLSARPVTIEEDVWIGANVVILPGVRIGAGTTVGAGSVVTKDLPARTICYGQPAKAQRAVPFA